MKTFVLLRSKIQKLPLAIAAFFDLLAGGFASCLGVDPLVPFLAYASEVAALYVEKRWAPLVLVSLGLSTYGAAVLKGEPVPLLLVAIFLKSVSPLFKGWLVLKSEVRELASVVGYLSENPQVLFALPFALLLTLAAIKLATGDLVMANRFAIYAYYQLVGAVVTAVIFSSRESASSRLTRGTTIERTGVEK
jgi:hypothetical protein